MTYIACGQCPLDGWVDDVKDAYLNGWVKMDWIWCCPLCRGPLLIAEYPQP